MSEEQVTSDKLAAASESQQVRDKSQIEHICSLKQQKAKVKSAFTKSKNKLNNLVECHDLPSRKAVRDCIDHVNDVHVKAMDVFVELVTAYLGISEVDDANKVQLEMDAMEEELNVVVGQAQEYLDNRSDTTTVSSYKLNKLFQQKQQSVDIVSKHSKSIGEPQLLHARNPSANSNASENRRPVVDEPRTCHDHNSSGHSHAIANDMWKQLKRVSIPVFSGDYRTYESWKSAFKTCIDQAPATAEYKLLQLRQYVSGEALKVIDSLGHSAAAYDIALQRLDRKFGGKRRQVSLQLEAINNLKPIRPGHARDVEIFADALDLAVVNLKEVDRIEELGNGLLYATLLKKMTEPMISQYQRWVYERERQESVETLREWIILEAEFQVIAAESIHGVSDKGKGESKRKDTRTYVSREHDNSHKASGDSSCKVCGIGKHFVWKCTMFKNMSIDNRWDTAKRLRLCFRCLGYSHRGLQCRFKQKCAVNGCTKTHNRLLHQITTANRVDPVSGVAGCQGSNTASNISSDSTVPSRAEGGMLAAASSKRDTTERAHATMPSLELEEPSIALRTVPVMLRNGSKRIRVNALLDDASTKSYINADVSAELGLQGSLQKISVHVLNGKTETFESKPVEFTLESLDGNIDIKMSAMTTNRVTGDLKVVDWENNKHKWNHLQNIDFPKVGKSRQVDLLIGLDYLQLHRSYEDVCGNVGEPFARLTPLGWTCIGNVNETDSCHHTRFAHTFYTSSPDSRLDALVEQFWELEEIKPRPQLLKADELILGRVQDSIVHTDGRYEVSIPWKDGQPSLPNDFGMAFRRLISTEQKLSKDPSIAEAYDGIISQYLEKGYIRRVSPDESTDGGWYLPHFPVIRPDKATTKVRIVFDASAKYENTSLNDAIHAGPKLQTELFDVLIRFRKKPIAIVCDISEMFLQIQMSSQDRPFHRFLWRSMNKSEKPQVYEFSRVVFGVTSSPFLAQCVTQEHAKTHQLDFPLAAETVMKSTYMDDSMDSVDNDSIGVELYNQLRELWSGAGMHARKWLSNSTTVLANIPEADRAAEVDLGKGNLPAVKALGLMWVAKHDIFTFKVQAPSVQHATKRSFLSQMARLFDPLGLIAPFVMTAKILLQSMWTSGFGWDDELPEYLLNKVNLWFDEWQHISNIQVPRCLSLGNQIESTSLHVFVDASENAYGAVVYVVNTYSDDTKSSRIVAAKGRVAPLKACSIPRLELMAAVHGVQLVSEIVKTLEIDIKMVTFWSDSMNVLGWIRNNSRIFKPFVANRIGEIQSSTNPTQWRHIASERNPADLISRGISVSDLADSQLWWTGPDFLEKDESEWPSNEYHSGGTSNDVDVEKKSYKKTVSLVTVGISDSCWKLEPSRFSSWSKLTRINAWVYRFLDNCVSPKGLRIQGDLTADEIHDAEARIIAKAQQDSFALEYSAILAKKVLPSHSKLQPLHPQIDEQGLLRLGGRLCDAECLSFETRFPIILPRRNWVTKLIVKSCHEQGHHAIGTNQTLALLSAKYWVISAREEIREWERECSRCRINKAKPRPQVMAPLPSMRLQVSMRAFSQTGVDFAGPFLTRQGRGKAQCKRYLCLFTCLTTRAVHLEMAYSLNTDAFLNAFYRMVNRRGLPKDVLSDNGTNFVGAVRELKELVRNMDKDAVLRSAANNGVRWHFNPPSAPHFGGVFEAMIKSAKRAIFAILSKADVTDEELQTAFTGAEALVNSRPLTYQTAHPQDETPLTPNHFLHGQIGGLFAPDAVDETTYHPARRWRRVQELVKHFWRRWMTEWLPSLNTRRKWHSSIRDFRVNDVVLVVSPELPRGQWKLGTVVRTYPGRDGHVRVVDLQIGKSVMTRPVTKICALEWTT